MNKIHRVSPCILGWSGPCDSPLPLSVSSGAGIVAMTLNCRAHTDIRAEVGHKRGDLLKLSIQLPQCVLYLLMGNDGGTGACQLLERKKRKELHRKVLN